MAEIIGHGIWTFYVADGWESLDPGRLGKWMVPVDDESDASELCEAAVDEGIVLEAKHETEPEAAAGGVTCFLYLHGDDDEGHRRLAAWLLANGLVPRSADGALEDLEFKHDRQTRAGQYGDAFVPDVTLGQFVDLATGEMVG